LLGDSGAVMLQRFNNGLGWNDNTSKYWDVVAAKNNSTNFQVLFNGTD